MATLRQEIEQHTRAFNKKPTISPTLSKTEGTTHFDIAERNISCPVQIPLESDYTQAKRQKQTYADMVKLSPPKGHAIPVIVNRQYNQDTTLCVQDTTDENVLPYQTKVVTKPKVSNNFPLAVDNNNMHSEHSSKPYTRDANKENLETPIFQSVRPIHARRYYIGGISENSNYAGIKAFLTEKKLNPRNSN